MGGYNSKTHSIPSNEIANKLPNSIHIDMEPMCAAELKELLIQLGIDDLTDNVLDEMVRMYDKDGDGALNYSEFLEAFGFISHNRGYCCFVS